MPRPPQKSLWGAVVQPCRHPTHGGLGARPLPVAEDGWEARPPSIQLQWLIVQPVVAGIGLGDYNNKVLTISSGWVSIAWGVFDFQSL